jgi:hypothetical protein
MSWGHLNVNSGRLVLPGRDPSPVLPRRQFRWSAPKRWRAQPIRSTVWPEATGVRGKSDAKALLTRLGLGMLLGFPVELRRDVFCPLSVDFLHCPNCRQILAEVCVHA